MRPWYLFFPLIAVVGLAITMPGWQHWLGQLSDAPSHIQFLTALIPPMLVLLLGASWLEPG